VFTTRFQRPKDEPIPDDLVEVASRIRADEESEGRRGRIIRRLIGLALVVGIIGGLGYVFLPSATVTLTPARKTVQATIDVIADPQSKIVDVENRITPATKLTVQIEETGKIETTGKQELGKTPATGSVVFINQKQQPVKIPSGTLVTTSAGTPIQFQTTKEASLPGGKGLQIEVPIEALPDFAGEIGNVNSGVINTVVGQLATSIAVRNIAATYGGASRTQRIVTASDRERLLATVRQQLQERAYNEMQTRLSKSQFIVLETIRIAEARDEWTTFSAKVGDEADTLSLTLRAVVEATAIDDQFGQQVAYASMSRQLERGQLMKPESVTYQRGTVSNVDATTGRITFGMTGNGLAISTIEAEQVLTKLAGLSLEEANTYLTSLPIDAKNPPQISLSQAWTGRMPILPFRISIVVQDAAT
jgi:hypothetical protein